MLLLDGDEDDIMFVIQLHWVLKRKRLMVLTRTAVDESIITDDRLDDSDQVETADLYELCVRTGVRVFSVGCLVLARKIIL